MQNFSDLSDKNIEHYATNTANVTDYGRDGFTVNGILKEGFYQLKDHRVVKLSELFSSNPKKATKKDYTFNFDIAEAAEKHKDQLKDLKGLGIDKNTSKARNGFYLCSDGKVISLKHLKAAVEAQTTKDIKETDVVDPQHVTSD